MIISDIGRLGRAASGSGSGSGSASASASGSASGSGSGPSVRWSCLARRGMLHSECEAVDYLELPPGAAITPDGRAGAEEAWYVLSGTAEIAGIAGRRQELGAGCLLLRTGTTAPEIRNGSTDEPLRLLLISVLPKPVTDRLPGRSPVAEETARTRPTGRSPSDGHSNDTAARRGEAR